MNNILFISKRSKQYIIHLTFIMKHGKDDSVIKQRLLDICNKLSISARSFSSSIGKSPTYLASLNNDITSAVLNDISINYPMVNIMWIITGNGTMLYEDQTKQCAQETEQTKDESVIYKMYKEKDAEARELSEEVGRIKSENNHLMERIENLKTEITLETLLQDSQVAGSAKNVNALEEKKVTP